MHLIILSPFVEDAGLWFYNNIILIANASSSGKHVLALLTRQADVDVRADMNMVRAFCLGLSVIGNNMFLTLPINSDLWPLPILNHQRDDSHSHLQRLVQPGGSSSMCMWEMARKSG